MRSLRQYAYRTNEAVSFIGQAVNMLQHVRVQAEGRLAEVGTYFMKPRWLPLYARHGKDIQTDHLGEIRIATWLGPTGDHGRLQMGACLPIAMISVLASRKLAP